MLDPSMSEKGGKKDDPGIRYSIVRKPRQTGSQREPERSPQTFGEDEPTAPVNPQRVFADEELGRAETYDGFELARGSGVTLHIGGVHIAVSHDADRVRLAFPGALQLVLTQSETMALVAVLTRGLACTCGAAGGSEHAPACPASQDLS
jgi:hypothetical protein